MDAAASNALWRAAIRTAICSARRQSIGDSAGATATGLVFPVSLRRELRGSDLLEVATNQTDDGEDRHCEKDDPEPEVKDDRCHAGQRSQHPVDPRTLRCSAAIG